MKFEPPSSHANLLCRVRPFDVVAAALCPPVALILRDPTTMSPENWASVALYCCVALFSTLAVYVTLGLGRGLDHFSSSEDAVDIWMTAIGAVAVTSAVIFTVTRLDDIPRSVPLIHLVLLGTTLSVSRAVGTFRGDSALVDASRTTQGATNVLVYGANRLSWFYIRMVDSLGNGSVKVLALIDDAPALQGRAFCGRPVLGGLARLDLIVEEYRTHGVQIDQLMIGYERAHLPSERSWSEITDLCAQCGVVCASFPEQVGLNVGRMPDQLKVPANAPQTRAIDLYWRMKRIADLCVAGLLIALLAPVVACVAVLIAIDIGAPVIFWQRRIGQGGAPFHIYKFRTLRAPFDRNGSPIPEERRLSRLGAFLRRTRLDEIPQLWNIIRGDMTFVGPRPLLPADQPRDSRRRLEVPPGITGWAQIHGGKMIEREEKAALDEWYVDNASLWLDMRIALSTFVIMCLGDRRNEQVVNDALRETAQGVVSLAKAD